MKQAASIMSNPSMQRWSLTVDKFIDHAARWHGGTEIVSRTAAGAIVRTDWAALRMDAARLTGALFEWGISPGDRVATLAMNGAPHLAAWFGIMGMGAVCHTLNPRLSEEQLVYIINHAEDRAVLADREFSPLLDRLRARCPSIQNVVLFDGDGDAGWEAILAGRGSVQPWGGFDEETAAGLCYTSGTTGTPKGVLYTHRSNYLHTLMIVQPDVFNISARDVVLPVVPMYHANAWGLTFAVAAVGAKLVLPGPKLDGASLYELLESEKVTLTAGVPTVWQTLLSFMAEHGLRFGALQRAMVGGAPCPESLIRAFAELGVEAQHNWGMTETSPLGTSGTLLPDVAALPLDQQMPARLKQGRVPAGVDMRIVDERGSILAHDGRTPGFLGVRGHSIVQRYFREDEDATDGDGFFDTGDVGSIDASGLLHITDRAKDLIKSGGEWISSAELESFAMCHPTVAIAAAIAAPDPKWGERPLLLLELKPGAVADAAGVRSLLEARMARWAVPDVIHFIDALPLGATGKIDKRALRERYAVDRV